MHSISSLISMLENPRSTTKNISNRQLLRAFLLAFSTFDASAGLVSRFDAFMILCFDFFTLPFDEVLVHKRYNFWYVYPFIAWHTVSAVCASDEAQPLIFSR